jgi:hypothetical protein
MKNQILILFTIILAIISCKTKVKPDEPIIEVRKVPEDGVVINKWQLLGPFPEGDVENSFDINSLECLGLKEDETSFNNLMNISKAGVDTDCKLDTTFANKYIFSGATPIQFKEMPGISKQESNANYYFGCLIRCKRAISTRLHFSSNKRAKIWLNNKLLCCADYCLPLLSYREFRPVKLNKGDNFLLVKINKPNPDLEMYARLENTSKRAMERYYGLRNHYILEGTIIIWGDTIKLNKSLPPENGNIKIFDSKDNLIINDSVYKGVRWSKSIADFKKGNYFVKAKFGDITLTQDIYKGDIIDSIQNIFNELRLIKTSDRIKRNIDVLNIRFCHLQKNTWWGDTKYVSIFIQIKNIYANLRKGVDPFQHTTGRFIRSYISEIDSSQQYYILHIPSSYRKGDAIPVGVTIPVNVYDKFPYLKSFRVGNKALIDFFQDLSEKYNMIIIEPGSRRKNKANYNPIEETEFFAILNDVESDYDIDRNRIYLAGTCSGGNELFKMTVKYPDLFAAAGVVAPDIIYVNEDANPWYKVNFPVMFLGNDKHLPIFDTHSIIDRHVPIESSENLDRLAKYFQLENFNYVKIPNEFPKYYPDDFYDDIFKFTQNYTLNKSPKQVDLTTNQMLYNKSFWVTITDMKIPGEAHIQAEIKKNKLTVHKKNITAYDIDLVTLPYNKDKPLKIFDNDKLVFNDIPKDSVFHMGPKEIPGALKKNSSIAGPLAHVFTQSFIVVKGTLGNQAENEAISALADTINKYWYKRYFANCRVKNDSEITKKDIEGSNLVLLGNPGSNLLYQRLNDSIPLTVSQTGIQINGKELKGDKLCFYMVYPNPLNKNKYIALVGYNNPDFVSLGSENSDPFNDVSNYGWYDYKVWDDSPYNAVEKGYFDSSWK